jgi:CheY-like chemotaxis protein
MAQELDRLRTEAAAAKRRAEDRDRLIEEIVHELRSPLHAALSTAEALAARIPAAAADARRIVQNILHASAVINDLKGSAEGAVLPRRPCDVRAVVSEALSLRLALLAPSVKLREEHAPEPLAVMGHARQLRQVVLNLVNNAEQAISEAGLRGEIVVRTQAAELSGARAARITIADDGPGIPDAVRDRIFEPHATTRAAAGGSGLGLAVSKKIVLEHGGTIAVDQTGPGGTQVSVTLPLTAAGGAGAPEPAPTPGRPRRILVVDDDAGMLETYRMILGLDEHEVTTETKGARAFELLRDGGFDAALVDVRMPDMPGPQLYNRLRAEAPAAAARMIFATGDLMNDATRSFLNSTGNPYLIKPFQIADLRHALQFVLARSAGA